MKKLGLALLAIGITLLVSGTLMSVTLALYEITTIPTHGASYQTLTSVSLSITGTPYYGGNPIDIDQIKYYQDGTYRTSLTELSKYSWSVGIAQPSVGSHTFNFEVYIELIDPTGAPYSWLWTQVGGSFTITAPPATLNGDWYIANILITSSGQVISLEKTKTIAFKFVKTAGTQTPTCTVSWTGPESGSITLSSTATNTWEGSYTFSQYGVYTVNLKATDGTATISFSILGTFGGGIGISKDLLARVLQIFGGSMALVGAALVAVDIYKERKS